MTEAAPTVTRLSRADHDSHPTSMGRVVPGVQAEVRAPRGEVGELWVRGPNVMLGYWNRAEATAAALVDGWYRTGDLAREDEDGYFFMVDRAKDMIITGGENVYSVEVEAVLSQHPAVEEVAVFGVPDDRWGEAVHAVVVARDAVSADELIVHCRSSLGGFKVPRAITFADAPLPKSGAGKLLKNRLREPFWKDHDRLVG
jgi:long-chain acyl-CoA synthetase